jgi:hypothetical protein
MQSLLYRRGDAGPLHASATRTGAGNLAIVSGVTDKRIVPAWVFYHQIKPGATENCRINLRYGYTGGTIIWRNAYYDSVCEWEFAKIGGNWFTDALEGEDLVLNVVTSTTTLHFVEVGYYLIEA